MLVAPFNDLETTTRLIAEHAGELAAVVLEPLQRCVVPLDGFLGGVLRVAREHHVVTVFDEVVTGLRPRLGRRPGVLPGPSATSRRTARR